MSVDIDEADAETAKLGGLGIYFVLSAVTGEGLEVSVYDGSPSDLAELRAALEEALGQKHQIVLLRSEAPEAMSVRWSVLDPRKTLANLPTRGP